MEKEKKQNSNSFLMCALEYAHGNSNMQMCNSLSICRMIETHKKEEEKWELKKKKRKQGVQLKYCLQPCARIKRCNMCMGSAG